METSHGLLFRLPVSRAKTEGRGFHPRPQTHNEAVRGCGMPIGRAPASKGRVGKVWRSKSSNGDRLGC